MTLPSNKIHIVNIAGATDQNSRWVANAMKEDMVELGWDPSEVDITQPTGTYDHDWTLEDLFNQEGYGIVVFVGDGIQARGSDGQDHFMLQGFKGGVYDHFKDDVTPERWAEYEDWMKSGKLVKTKTPTTTSPYLTDQVYVQGELLAEQIRVDPGAMVHFISDFSYDGLIEAIMTADDGAGAVSGWTDWIDPGSGRHAFEGIMAHMVGTEGNAESLLLAQQHAREDGLTNLTGFFGDETLLLGGGTGGLYLPASMEFDAPFDCLEAGTEYYEVNVSYTDCPELNQSFQFFPGGEHSLSGLPPVGADLEFVAKDGSGNTLGSGRWGMALKGGANTVELCPCEGDLSFLLTNIPPGGGYGSSLVARMFYDDPTIESRMVQQAWPATVARGFQPGTGRVHYTLTDGEGKAIGYTEDLVDIGCDANTSVSCFGWLTLTSSETWDQTASIVVTGVPDHADHPTRQVVLPPGGEVDMLGLGYLDLVSLTAEARSSAGEVLDVVDLVKGVGCGENQVTIDFDTYGIILSAEPTRAHRTRDEVVVTATVREWEGFDIDQPSGDPVEGVTVHFATTHGYFVGADHAVTGSDGVATAILGADEAGTAAVRAFTSSPDVDSEPVQVEFPKFIRIILNRMSGSFTGDTGWDDIESNWLERNCAVLKEWVNEYEISGSESTAYARYYLDLTWPLVGDTVRYVWTRGSGCNFDNDPPRDRAFISSAWVHYFHPGDRSHQISYQLMGAVDPLSGTYEAQVIIQDPTAPAAAPSAFDLQAMDAHLAREVLNFRQ